MKSVAELYISYVLHYKLYSLIRFNLCKYDIKHAQTVKLSAI